MRTLGALARYAAFVTPVFDAGENYALLRVLLGYGDAGYPAIAAFCAILKFSLMGFGALYAMTAWLLPEKQK